MGAIPSSSSWPSLWAGGTHQRAPPSRAAHRGAHTRPRSLRDGGPSFIIHHIGLERGLPSFIIMAREWPGYSAPVGHMELFSFRFKFQCADPGDNSYGYNSYRGNWHSSSSSSSSSLPWGGAGRGLPPGLDVIRPWACWSHHHTIIHHHHHIGGHGAGLLGSCDLGGDRAA